MSNRSNYQFQPGDHVSVESHPGIAFSVIDEETQVTEETVWTGYESPTGRISARMVGDNRVFSFDPDELTLLSEHEFCGGCGQLGCTWDNSDTDETV